MNLQQKQQYITAIGNYAHLPFIDERLPAIGSNGTTDDTTDGVTAANTPDDQSEISTNAANLVADVDTNTDKTKPVKVKGKINIAE